MILITGEKLLIVPFLECQWTIYSATAFLERCRKVVREIWFEKSGSRKVVDQKKGGFIL